MKQSIAHIALLVREYDEAIDFYTTKLSFTLTEDTSLSSTKRWVLIAPPGSVGTQLLLAKADNDIQKIAIGNQSGGRVFLFLYTDDFYRDYHAMKNKGIEFVRDPSHETYGMLRCLKIYMEIYGI